MKKEKNIEINIRNRGLTQIQTEINTYKFDRTINKNIINKQECFNKYD